MATPSREIKTSARGNGGAAPSHADLFMMALRHLVALELEQHPDLDYGAAQAQVVRQLAATLGVSRDAIYVMRQRRRVSARHWNAFERATGGAVTAEDFERAANG